MKKRDDSSGYHLNVVLFAAMVIGLLGAYFTQHKLNNERSRLSPTHLEQLQGAPPMLALTANALGGFRGIMATYLWLRANKMQLENRYAEQMQLSEWVSQLQPNVPTVWVNRAWNMAYNISKTYEDPEIRWRYVYDGIRMIRDRGLKYNPQEPLLYNELSYIFQHKIGHNLDDKHRYYKLRWMELIQSALWESADDANQVNGVPNFEELINPPNERVEARVKKLRVELGLDPIEMREVHEKYGRTKKNGEWVDVMDWRFPEVQSLYWSYLGLKRCAHNPSREIELRRLEKKIYVSMMYLFYRGRMGLPSGRQITPQQFVSDRFFVEPNIELAPATHRAYLDMIEKAQASRLDHHTEGTVEIGHLHFIERNITWLYFLNREIEALEWLKLASEMYPKQMSWKRFYNNTENVVNLDELVMAELEDDIQRGGDYQVQAILIGMLKKYYTSMALGNEAKAIEYGDFIARVYERHQSRFVLSKERMGLPPLEKLRIDRLRAFLQEEDNVMVARLRTVMGLGENELPVYAPTPSSNE